MLHMVWCTWDDAQGMVHMTWCTHDDALDMASIPWCICKDASHDVSARAWHGVKVHIFTMRYRLQASCSNRFINSSKNEKARLQGYGYMCVARLITRAFLNHSSSTDKLFDLGLLRSFSSLHNSDMVSTSGLVSSASLHHKSLKEINLISVRVKEGTGQKIIWFYALVLMFSILYQ